MNEHAPLGDFLQISKEELESLFKSAARSLVIHGEVEINEDGERFRQSQDKGTHNFSYQLPKYFAKQIFFPNDRIDPLETYVEYADEHRIDDAPDNDGLLQSVYIVVRGRMLDQPVFISYILRISQDDRLGPDFTADVDVQYSDFEGHSITMSPVEGETYDQMAERYMESVRDITLDDVDQVRRVIDYINLHGRKAS